MMYAEQAKHIREYTKRILKTNVASFASVGLDPELFQNKYFKKDLLLHGVKAYMHLEEKEPYVFVQKEDRLSLFLEFCNLLNSDDFLVEIINHEMVFTLDNLTIYSAVSDMFRNFKFKAEFITVRCGDIEEKLSIKDYRKLPKLLKSIKKKVKRLPSANQLPEVKPALKAVPSSEVIVDAEILESEEVLTDIPEIEHIVVKEDQVLTPTSESPLVNYSYTEFNRFQSPNFKYWNQDTNVVALGRTSVGKTTVAEMHLSGPLLNGGKAVMISPLKSVTQQQYREWTSKEHAFSDYNVTLLTGDNKASVSKLNKSDLILMTSEMLGSKTRRPDQHKWVKEIKTIVVDEFHLIGVDGRGDSLEIGLMNLALINPDVKIVVLSATMPNVMDMAQFLGRLNKKKTAIVECDWRPVEVTPKFAKYSDAGKTSKIRNAEKLNKCLELVQEKPSEKFLIFVHSKFEGRELVKRLESEGIKSGFHNSSLNFSDRLKLELDFAKKDSDLRVLVSTSTLAWGVNLPARNVIIMGVQRGLELIHPMDIIQMIGRAGRIGIDTEGFATIICPDSVDYSLDLGNIQSTLLNEDKLLFHVVSVINNGLIQTVEEFANWFEKSLAYIQGERLDSNLVNKILNKLVEFQAVEIKNGKIVPTQMAAISSKFYMSPERIYRWKENFEEIFKKEIDHRDVAVAWALTGNIKEFDNGYVPKGLPIKKYLVDLAGFGLTTSRENAVYGLAIQKMIVKGHKRSLMNSALSAAMFALSTDVDRSLAALLQLNDLFGWGKQEFLESLAARIKYAIPKELLELTEIRGVGVRVAKKLYERGIATKEELYSNWEEVSDLLSDQVITQIAA